MTTETEHISSSSSNNNGSGGGSYDVIKFKVGDLIWAKVSGHPWWPCIISRDVNDGNTYVKSVGTTRQKRMYFVEFFGPSAEYAWVSEGCLIEYCGIESFKTYAQDQVDQAPTKSAKEKLAERFQLKVALTRRDHWEQAVEEADEALSKRKATSGSGVCGDAGQTIHQSNVDYDSEEENNTPKLGHKESEETENSAASIGMQKRSSLPSNMDSAVSLASAASSSTSSLNKAAGGAAGTSANKRKRLSSLANSEDKDSLLSLNNNNKTTKSKRSPFNSDPRNAALGKREIRKPKFFLEQEKAEANAKLQQQQDNLTLLSQIATATNDDGDKQFTRKKNGVAKFESDDNESESSTRPARRAAKQSASAKRRRPAKQEPIEYDDSNNGEEESVGEENEENENESGGGDDDGEDDEEDILDEIDVEYEKLQQATAIRKENICSVCEMPGFLIDCQGPCLQSFHLDCIGLLNEPKEGFKCEECVSGLHTCFACKKPSTLENMAKKCSSSACGHYYHDECVKPNELIRKDNNKSTFTCPLHTCQTCIIESRQYGGTTGSSENDPDSSNSRAPQANSSALSNVAALQASKGRFMRCIRCPTAYHAGDYCIAAGSIVLAGCNMICPNHFQPVKGQSQHNRVNVTWCFVCCKSGDLLGCDSCPAAYHYGCLDNPPVPNATQPWKCEDCERNKRQVYGEIVWVKVGVYRWWPAQICHPRNLPKNIRERPHQVGEFPVRFFGTNDYFWVTRNRCFSFAEDDECTKSSSKQKGLAVAFEKGVHHAQIAFKHVQKLKLERFNKLNGRDALKCAKYNFQFIKTNKPVGNVQVHKVPLSDLPRCDCDPKVQNPCSTDDCLNRILKYECHPGACAAGERCQNQRFVKRQYPRQEPRQTPSRGWGLHTLVDIKKGEFVNEYVGELIDDDECKKRLEDAYQNDICNFYFLTIDKDRIVDAGPKGNLSRFMNHSCEPNIETQKWNVNGDIRVGLFALCDIAAGTELTFNYNLDCLGNEKAVCKCGAKNCSGFLGVRPSKNNNSASTNSLSSLNKNKDKGRPSKKRKVTEVQDPRQLEQQQSVDSNEQETNIVQEIKIEGIDVHTE